MTFRCIHFFYNLLWYRRGWRPGWKNVARIFGKNESPVRKRAPQTLLFCTFFRKGEVQTFYYYRLYFICISIRLAIGILFNREKIFYIRVPKPPLHCYKSFIEIILYQSESLLNKYYTKPKCMKFFLFRAYIKNAVPVFPMGD